MTAKEKRESLLNVSEQTSKGKLILLAIWKAARKPLSCYEVSADLYSFIRAVDCPGMCHFVHSRRRVKPLRGLQNDAI